MPSGTTNGACCVAQQGPHGGQVEVVVVVVGDERRRRPAAAPRQRHRRRVQPRRARAVGDGDTRSPHTGSTSTRCAVDLEQRAGVAEPGDGELGGLVRELRAGQRDRAAREADVPLLVPLPQQPVAGRWPAAAPGWAACCGTCRRTKCGEPATVGRSWRGCAPSAWAAPTRRGPPSSPGRRGRRRRGRCGGARTTARRPASQARRTGGASRCGTASRAGSTGAGSSVSPPVAQTGGRDEACWCVGGLVAVCADGVRREASGDLAAAPPSTALSFTPGPGARRRAAPAGDPAGAQPGRLRRRPRLAPSAAGRRSTGHRARTPTRSSASSSARRSGPPARITDPRNGRVYAVPGYRGYAGLGPGDAARVELDHFLPLSDGGDGYDPANLWPEIGGTAQGVPGRGGRAARRQPRQGRPGGLRVPPAVPARLGPADHDACEQAQALVRARLVCQLRPARPAHRVRRLSVGRTGMVARGTSRSPRGGAGAGGGRRPGVLGAPGLPGVRAAGRRGPADPLPRLRRRAPRRLTPGATAVRRRAGRPAPRRSR